MEKQKCPLMLITRPSGDCIKEKCAWFVPAEQPDGDWTGDCAVSLIGGSLRNIESIMDELGFDLYKMRIGDNS